MGSAARRRVRVAAALSAVALVAASARATAFETGAGEASQATEGPAEWVPFKPLWDVVETRGGGRIVEIAHEVLACSSARGFHVLVHETAADVIFDVSEELGRPGSEEEPFACPPPAEVEQTVALAHPLAGRPIRGRSATQLAASGRGGFLYVGKTLRSVPRVIGLSSRDALHALAFDYLKGVVVRTVMRPGHSRVLDQVPRPPESLKTGALVRIVVSSPSPQPRNGGPAVARQPPHAAASGRPRPERRSGA
jgi:hypothetical protein